VYFKGLLFITVRFYVSFDHSGFVLLARFAGFGFFSVPSQETGWEERL